MLSLETDCSTEQSADLMPWSKAFGRPALQLQRQAHPDRHLLTDSCNCQALAVQTNTVDG